MTTHTHTTEQREYDTTYDADTDTCVECAPCIVSDTVALWECPCLECRTLDREALGFGEWSDATE